MSIIWLSVPAQLIGWKDSSQNDPLCVELDINSYHSYWCVLLILTLCVHCTCVTDGQSSSKDVVPTEGAAAMALKAELVFKRAESRLQLCHDNIN